MKKSVVPVVQKSGVFPLSAEELFALLSKPSTFERSLPRSWDVRSLRMHGLPCQEGASCVIQLRLGHKTRVSFCNVVPQKSFTEVWDKEWGRKWRRTRTIQREGASTVAIFDEIHASSAEQQSISDWSFWQCEMLRQDCLLFAKAAIPPLRILLSGAQGFIGSQLKLLLEMAGCTVIALSRNQQKGNSVYWEPHRAILRTSDFEGFDAVIHLAGENIASARWTESQKRKLFLSRARDTWLLSHALLRAKKPPRVMIVGSAVGFYGDRGEEVLTEKSSHGSGFLPELCQAWERATDGLEQKGVRIVHARFGTVVGQRGGILRKLLPIFRLGLGGILGKGDQYWSWISMDDVISALLYLLAKEEVKGPVNFVSEQPLRQREWVQLLAQHVHRPMFFSIPRWALRLRFGEMADAIMLASAKVVPRALLQAGYSFRTPLLLDALRSA